MWESANLWGLVLPLLKRKEFLKHVFWKSGTFTFKARGRVCLPCRGVGTKAASVEVNGNPSVAFSRSRSLLTCPVITKKERNLWQGILSESRTFPPLLLTPSFLVLQRKLVRAHLFCCLGTALDYLQQKERKENPESHAFPRRLAPSLRLSSAGAACQSRASTNRCDSRALSAQWKRHYSLNRALKAAKFTSLRIFHWGRRFLSALLQGAGIWACFIYLFPFPLCADIIPTFSIWFLFPKNVIRPG